MISPDILTIPEAGQDLYGKSSEAMASGLYVCSDGTVTGTFHYLSDYEGFSSKAAEKKGYYFPFTLTKQGQNMTFAKNGKESKKNIKWEANNVFRITADDTFTVSVDGKEVVTFNFTKAKFDPQG